MTSPRNLSHDPTNTVEQLLQNFTDKLSESKPDFEALMFLSARMQRVALTAIAGPSILTGSVDRPRSAAMNALAMQKLARRALDAVETMEECIGRAQYEYIEEADSILPDHP